jgi:hypothetical protein
MAQALGTKWNHLIARIFSSSEIVIRSSFNFLENLGIIKNTSVGWNFVFDMLIKIQPPHVPTLRVVNMFVNLGLLHNRQGRVEVFGFMSMISWLTCSLPYHAGMLSEALNYSWMLTSWVRSLVISQLWNVSFWPCSSILRAIKWIRSMDTFLPT